MRKLSALAAGAFVCLLLGPAAASAAPPYPISFNFLDAIAAQGANQNGPPPGANDFNCRPSTAHPEPVVLVHGLLANQTVNWNTMSPLLANDGYCVFSLTYGTKDGVAFPFYQPGGLKKMEDSAGELAGFVNEVLAATGAQQVDIVGHSEGSLMPNYYVKHLGGAAKVDDYVGLTTLWDGTNLLALDTLNQLVTTLGGPSGGGELLDQFCESCDQFLHSSPFMDQMRAGGVAHPSVNYTNIVTRYDELVVPYTSGLMPPGPNVTNYVLQDLCELDLAEHNSVAADPVAGTLILNALAPAHRRPIPCQLVLPALGAPLATAPAPLDSDGDSDPDFSDPCPTQAGQTNCPAPGSAGAGTGNQLGATGASTAASKKAAKKKCKKLRQPRAKRRCLRRARGRR